MKKKSLIPLLLVIIMLFTTVSPIFAVTVTPENLTASDIVSEDVEKREKFAKHYLTGDGSYFAVAYAEQVNYQDENGDWQEVDNSISTNVLTGEKITNNEKFKVKFANKANNDKLVSIQTDDFKVSWGLSVSENGADFSSLNKIKGTELGEKKNERKTTTDVQSLGKAVSGIVYEDAFGSYLDVRYSVAHQKVKEDLILNERSGFKSYKVTYNIKDSVRAELADNGEVIFYGENDEILFRATTPIMYDSVGKASADISVSLTATAKTVEVIYTPNAEWLADEMRVYPVTIDPEFQTSNDPNNITDVSMYYDRLTAASTASPYLNIGMDYYTYINFENIPTIPSGTTLIGADMVLYTDSYTAPSSEYSPNISLFEIAETWSDDSTIFDAWNPSSGTEQYITLSRNMPALYSNGVNSCVEMLSSDSYRLTLSIPTTNINTASAFNSYFDNYNGYEVYLDYCDVGISVFSSEYSGIDYATKRPCMIFRYSYNNTTTIDINITYYLKNNYSNNYFTMSNDNQNVTLSTYTPTANQGVRFIYNTSNDYYIIKSVQSNTYIGYSIDTPNALSYNLYNYNTDVSTTRWILVSNPNGTYSIVSSDNSDYIMSITNTTVIVKKIISNSNLNVNDEWHLDWILRMPNKDAQNKTNWCWAACAKMVGEHNYGAGTLPVGASLVTYSNIDEFHYLGDSLFYGETMSGEPLVDAGQRSIVVGVHGNADNLGGDNDDKEAALRIVAPNANIGTWGLDVATAGNISNEDIASMKSELSSGNWVIANLYNSLFNAHSIVITQYDSEEGMYYYWDPSSNITYSFTEEELTNGSIKIPNDAPTRRLFSIQYCN